MDDDKLYKKVKEIVFLNLEAGYSQYLNRNYTYIKPSHQKYPFQWFWDTFFHIYILCRLEEYDLAKKNLESLFTLQKEDGFVGHVIFWQQTLPTAPWQVLQAEPNRDQIRPHMSALIQPTFAAQVLKKIHEATGDNDFLKTMLPKIKKYNQWLEKNRDLDNDGLISIISPFESGIDHKPSYDELMGFHGNRGSLKLYLKMHWLDLTHFFNRYNLQKIYKADRFLVKDTLVNTIYAADLAALSELCKQTEDPDAEKFSARAAQTTQSILKQMYDQEDRAFYDIKTRGGKKLKALTPSIFFPIVLPGVPEGLSREIINKHLINQQEFNVPFPLPSVAKNSPIFNPKEARWIFGDYLWRGPTWIFYNWFLYRCLKNKGFEELAVNLREATIQLIEKSGFREYYNPLTGEGYGARNFTWSGLILDMLD